MTQINDCVMTGNKTRSGSSRSPPYCPCRISNSRETKEWRNLDATRVYSP
jgi:hypothetical protein